MNPRYLLLGSASAVTTFLLAGAMTIEILSTWYGEGPGVGILGVIVGLLVGAAITFTGDRLSGIGAEALVAYAVFGVAFLAITSLSYMNIPGADEVFTFPVHLAVSFVVSLVAAVLASCGRVSLARTGV